MRRALLVLAVVVAGCGGEEREARPAAPAATEVTVTVDPGGTRKVRCPGDELCARLQRADFSPPKGQLACTDVYGGDETARVVGRVRGERVDARFSRTNGCEIARWDRFAWLLGSP